MSVNAAPSSKGMSFGMRVTDCGMASATWAYPPRVSVVLTTRAITCSPAGSGFSAGNERQGRPRLVLARDHERVEEVDPGRPDVDAHESVRGLAGLDVLEVHRVRSA